MEKIKILYIIDMFNKLAGAEKNLLDLSTRLNKERFEPIVFTLHAGKANNLFSENNIRVFDLKIKKIYSLIALAKAIKLIHFIKKENIKIVVTYHEGSDFYGGIIARMAGVQVVISSRRDMGYRLTARHIFLYKIVNKLFNKILAVSDAVKDIIEKRENTVSSKIITIHNGVEVNKFTSVTPSIEIRQKFGIEHSVPIIGILAALRQVKGHRYFIEAASIVAKEFPESRFLIIGTPENSKYLNELKGLARSLGIGNNVIFTGEHRNVPEILSIIDISVLASLNEGFSNTILESMSAGKPVVATNTGGTPEAVVDGVTGILIPPSDAKALAEGILRLLRDKQLRVSMGGAGKLRAARMFDVNVMISSIEKLYESLIRNAELKVKYTNGSIFSSCGRHLFELFKVFVGAGIRYSGTAGLIRNISKYPKILAYHRINDDAFDPLSMNISVSIFESHLLYLKKHYRFVTLAQAVDYLESGKKLPDNSIALTFDDGYRDNYTNAFPLLKKYNIPATIFLSVDDINHSGALWYDDVSAAIHNSNLNIIDLKKYGLDIYNTSAYIDKISASRRIIRLMKYMPADKRNAIIAYIKNITKDSITNNSSSMNLLNWDEINEMKKYGISFGSHGMSHSILTTLTYEAVKYEVFESKKIIQEKINQAVDFFAYPNGSREDFNNEVVKMLKNAGYRGACTLFPGVCKTSSLFSVGRYCISPGMLSWLPEVFSGTRFELSLVKGSLADIR